MFKPMLANNQQPNLDDLLFPQLISMKMDGVRVVFYKGQILTRSLKQLPNKQLREKFEPIRKYSEENNIILDGEAYSSNLTFQEIISFCMTQDFTEKKSIKKFGHIVQIPDHLKFYCFDYLDEGLLTDCYFSARVEAMKKYLKPFNEICGLVEQKECNNLAKIESHFSHALENGYEGLILKNPKGKYKFGRTTLKENLMFKLKPFITIDAKVIGVVQATEVDPNAEKKINELGRSVTSKKVGDRILIEKASAFNVKYDGKDLKVVLAMPDAEKEEVWQNRESYIGRMIEYKGMLIGSKDVPRHPVMLRFRSDKE